MAVQGVSATIIATGGAGVGVASGVLEGDAGQRSAAAPKTLYGCKVRRRHPCQLVHSRPLLYVFV